MAAQGGTPTSSTATHVFEMLRHLDAGRAANSVHALARHAALLPQSLAGTGSGQAAPSELTAACERFARSYGPADHAIRVLPHIGWGDVVDESEPAYRRYGFSTTRSFETFEELLRYLSGACRGLERIHALAEATPGAIARDSEDWTAAREVLDRAADAVREIRAQTEDFARRRQLSKERAATEKDTTVALLLEAIGNVRSPWAWLRRSPESRLVECAPTGDYRLRLGFADGTIKEIELGSDYWSTTGHAPDATEFRGVRLDRDRNRLVWANGVEIPGERLHLAIAEGRL